MLQGLYYCSVAKGSFVVGCDAVSLGECCPTLRRSAFHSSPRNKQRLTSDDEGARIFLNVGEPLTQRHCVEPHKT
jgi:hypothetical protein